MATDYTADPAFTTTLFGVQAMIQRLAALDVADAQALVDRQHGEHNLQGHARRLIPLAVWLARQHPDILRSVRRETVLATAMDRGSTESRNRNLWSEVQEALRDALASCGDDLLTERDRTNAPASAKEAANAYLPVEWGGTQVGGGGGATVIKRALKLMSHTLVV